MSCKIDQDHDVICKLDLTHRDRQGVSHLSFSVGATQRVAGVTSRALTRAPGCCGMSTSTLKKARQSASSG